MKGITVYLFAAALTLSGIAAYYSIVGLAAMFSSAFWPVVLMAGTLEVSKLIVASWLYHKWNQIPILLKAYLTAAVLVLMMITSLGIFGFLSRAHVDQGLINTNITLLMAAVDTEISSAQSSMARLEAQQQQLDRSIDIQLNANRATQAQAARRTQQAEREQIRAAIADHTQQLLDLAQRRTQLEQQLSVVNSKLGAIRYVAEIFSDGDADAQEAAVRWVIVILVLVFDPLAVLMIIAANISVRQQQAQSVPTHTQGEIRWDPVHTRFVCWTGTDWQPMQSVTPPMESVVNSDQITAVVNSAMHQWLQEALSVTPTVDPNSIRDAVEQAVNQGITRIQNMQERNSRSWQDTSPT